MHTHPPQFRDFYMERWISLASVDGVNVALYGAAHRPMRFVRSHDLIKRALIEVEEVEEKADSLFELWWLIEKEKLLALAEIFAMPSEQWFANPVPPPP